MIELILEKYKKYDLHYNTITKILYVYKPMLVKDFVELKEIIKDYEVDIKEIRIIEEA